MTVPKTSSTVLQSISVATSSKAAQPSAPVVAHVNQHVIKHNTKHGTTYPSLTIKVPGQGTYYAYEVEGYARLVDCNSQGRKPLACGARVWMEYSRETFAFVGQTMRWAQLKSLLAQDRDSQAVIATLENAEMQTACLV